MASMTYCRSARRCRHRVEQIVLLITAFLVYASGIRNVPPQGSSREDGTKNEAVEFGGTAAYGPTDRPFYQQATTSGYGHQGAITPPSASAAAPQSTESSNRFQPSQQILEFTLSDVATTLHNYPPSYLNSVFNGQSSAVRDTTPHSLQTLSAASQQLQALVVADKRYENNGQISFPNGQGGVSTVRPPNTQTEPILSYHDPFTYQSYQASSTSKLQFGNNDIILASQQQKGPIAAAQQHQQQQHRADAAPQSYTVKSTLFVGNGPNRADDNGVPHGFDTTSNGHHALSAPNNEYMRPGYVFDEQIRPNYMGTNNIKLKQQYHQYQHLNALPADIVYDNNGSQQRPVPRPQRLSYDSNDYPPPSYHQMPTHQQHHQGQEVPNQHLTYFQTPQRQDIGFPSISQPAGHFNAGYLNAAPTLSTPPSKFSNYANNFGNYLLTDASQQQQQHFQYTPNRQQQQQRPPPLQYPLNDKAPAPPGNLYLQPSHHRPYQQQLQQQPPHSAYRPTAQRPSNYYDYQLGEIPPPPPPPPRRPTPPAYPNYGPQRPAVPPPPASGLASLSSLFTTTQQYAPQFTDLLLGALTGDSEDAAASTASRPSQQKQRPINMQFIKALENIARNDHLQCVPKVLCQTIASQTQRGQLPNFLTSPAITKFLENLPAASPALIYGRAALLGISGGEGTCAQTYAKCPKSEVEILHYLNNHRGGFFKFFSEPEEQPATSSTSSAQAANGNYDDGGSGGVSSSLLSILSVLTGSPTPTRRPTTTTTTTTQRPVTSLDVAGGIGNLFIDVLSNYLGGVEHQRRRQGRRRRRRYVDTIEPETEMVEAHKILQDEDFHDDEDNDDTENDDDDEQYEVAEARILNADEASAHAKYPKFFPEENANLEEVIKTFNARTAERKLKFPNGDADENREQWISFKAEEEHNFEATESTRRGAKKLTLDAGGEYNQVEDAVAPPGQRVIFPDHYEQHIRKSRILNRPNYAASYGDYVHNDEDNRFAVSSNHRIPYYRREHQSDTSYYSQTEAHYSSTSSSHQETGFLPTPIPLANSHSDNSNHNKYNNYNKKQYNYPNNNYVSNNRYSSSFPRYMATTTTTRRPRHEDDQNIYVTNGRGITEYYITPDGRKVFL